MFESTPPTVTVSLALPQYVLYLCKGTYRLKVFPLNYNRTRFWQRNHITALHSSAWWFFGSSKWSSRSITRRTRLPHKDILVQLFSFNSRNSYCMGLFQLWSSETYLLKHIVCTLNLLYININRETTSQYGYKMQDIMWKHIIQIATGFSEFNATHIHSYSVTHCCIFMYKHIHVHPSSRNGI